MQNLKAKFDDYYNHHLLGKFMEMEAERHKQMDVFIKRLLLTGIFIPLLILLFWSSLGRLYRRQPESDGTDSLCSGGLCFYFAVLLPVTDCFFQN